MTTQDQVLSQSRKLLPRAVPAQFQPSASPVPAQCQPRSVSPLLPRDTERKRKVLQLSHSALDTELRSTLRGWGGKWSAHHNTVIKR